MTQVGPSPVTWKLKELLAGLHDSVGASTEYHKLRVAGLSLDSRDVRAGDLFFARPGSRTDGACFLVDSLARGAVAVVAPLGTRQRLSLDSGAPVFEVDDVDRVLGEVAARFFAWPSDRIAVLGITGTNGKTTVAHLIAQASAGLGTTCAYLGTLGVGIPGELVGAGLTTPDAITLNRHLVGLVRAGARRLAMEVSSHALSQGRTSGLRIKGAVFTNLSHDHLDYHGSMAAYAVAKQRLFASASLEWAIVKADDRATSAMLEPLGNGVQVIAWTVSDGSEVSVDAGVEERLLELGARRLAGRLESPGTSATNLHVSGDFGECTIVSSLVGEFNAENLISALASLLAEGTPLQSACAALGRCTAPPGRLERVAEVANAPDVFVDYSHTPDSLEKALLALRPICAGELWCVFGCGGNRDRDKRPRMGAIAARLADRLVVTDDNPRDEASATIIGEIVAGIPAGTVPTVQPDRYAAIRSALQAARAEDVVLIAGKGHEDYQEVCGQRWPFSDRASARELLRERSV